MVEGAGDREEMRMASAAARCIELGNGDREPPAAHGVDGLLLHREPARPTVDHATGPRHAFVVGR
jgi:hypothetical protein